MTEIDRKLVVALDWVLMALIEHREQRAAFPTRVQSAAQIEQRPRPTADDHLLDRLARDPVGGALRAAVTRIGEIANKAGGMRVMSALENEVRKMSPEQDSQRADIIDKAWDGIGNWRA